MGITRDDVFKIVQEHGPVVANKIATLLGSDSFLVGAYLSELSENKQILLTRSSGVGTSFYYVTSQVEKLVSLRDRLKEQDRRTFDLINEEKVLRDSDLEPLTRVSIAKLSDFAKEVNIRMGDETVLFWKWYMLNNDEVVGILQKRYTQKEEPVQKESTTQTPSSEGTQNDESSETVTEPVSTPIESSQADSYGQSIKYGLVGKKTAQEIITVLEAAGIKVTKSVDIKKTTESDCICTIPTALGNQSYFVKIMLKAKISDSELQAIYLQGILKQKPVCLITNGTLTKKAEVLHDGDLRSLLVLSFS